MQIVMSGETTTTGIGFTVTVTCAVELHPFTSVPVTVYVVVDAGLAVTLVPVVALSPVAGDHAYVLAPFAVSVADCPAQIADGVFTVTTGSGLTVTVTCPVAEHPLEVPVTVYVVVVVGFAVTGEPVDALSPVEGVHEYVVAPVAVSVVDCPLQIEMLGETVSIIPFTVTVTCADAVHPFIVPVTV
jgi:hypothetical protein